MTAHHPADTGLNIFDGPADRVHDHPDIGHRDRYGRINWGACFFGWLVALDVGVVLSGVVAALLATRASRWVVPLGRGEVGLTAAGLSAALALIGVVAIAHYAGGYVAGRMSRFDGGKQGCGVWVVGQLLAGATMTLGLHTRDAAELPLRGHRRRQGRLRLPHEGRQSRRLIRAGRLWPRVLGIRGRRHGRNTNVCPEASAASLSRILAARSSMCLPTYAASGRLPPTTPFHCPVRRGVISFTGALGHMTADERVLGTA